jgi:tetraacyldisaccharide 4'-kinase
MMTTRWRKSIESKDALWWLVLKPLSWLYRLAWAVAAVFSGKPVTLSGLRVVSVGNLSVGGTGKSSLVRLLARESLRRGFKTAVLLRGYGAKQGLRPLWVDAKTAVEACGDEAAEHRRIAGLQVIVDADRLRGAKLAKARGIKVLILDDGFQRRRQLARQADFLLAAWPDIEGGEHLLPAGPWREPWSQAREATHWLLQDRPAKAALPDPWGSLPLTTVGYKPVGLKLWKAGRVGPGPGLAGLKGKRVLALSGLGRPQRFEQNLKSLGALVTPRRFADHHAYRLEDLENVGDVKAVVTTMKDAMRLPGGWNPGIPVWVLEAELDGPGLKAAVKEALA